MFTQHRGPLLFTMNWKRQFSEKLAIQCWAIRKIVRRCNFLLFIITILLLNQKGVIYMKGKACHQVHIDSDKNKQSYS